MNSAQALAMTDESTMEMYVEAYEQSQGRPIIYNELVGAEIIARLSNSETLRGICRDVRMPSYGTVYRWMDKSVSFCNAIKRARRSYATGRAEQAIEVLENCDDSTMPQVQKADKCANMYMIHAKAFDRETFGDKVTQDVNVRGVVIHTDNTELAKLMNSDD